MTYIDTDSYFIAPESAYGNWNYTLDDVNDIITLNYYAGSEANVIVYGNYPIEEKTYKTRIASNASNATNDTMYMFNGNAQSNCKNIKTITFSSGIDTSNVTDMGSMFCDCTNLKAIYATSGKWTTAKASTTNMFSNCGTSSVTYR